MKKINKIFVYGSLRQGGRLHHALGRNVSYYQGQLRGFKMFSLGGYPFIVSTGDYNDIVIGEVYGFNNKGLGETLPLLDQIESGAGFDRTIVRVDTMRGIMDAWAYYFKTEPLGNVFDTEVLNGDWMKTGRYLKAEGGEII